MWQMCLVVGDSVDLHTAVRFSASGDSRAPAGLESCHSLQSRAFTTVFPTPLHNNNSKKKKILKTKGVVFSPFWTNKVSV